MIVLHDMRLEINGRFAQIDHLLMNRGFDLYVLETKTFNTGVSINERGKFSTTCCPLTETLRTDHQLQKRNSYA